MECKKCGGKVTIEPQKPGLRTRWYECKNCGPVKLEDIKK